MERTKIDILAAFRRQLWFEHLPILEESEDFGLVYFIIEGDYICSYSIMNLMKIHPFGMALLYFEGNKRICISLDFR